MSQSLATNLAAVEAAIASLGPPPAPSVRQAILARRAELRAKHAEGHSYEDIAAALTREGLPIKANTLRAYLTGDAYPSRAGRSAAKAAQAKTKHEAMAVSASQPKDEQKNTNPGCGSPEATPRSTPVIATRIK